MCVFMHGILEFLRKHLPKQVFVFYHRSLSWLAAFWYGRPSRHLIVIGVTGTNGKSTTSYLIAKALEAHGAKTGCTSTALFKVADKVWTNATKMTMLGRFESQRLLKAMVDAGCRYAVIETSSQGILQDRHKEIAYDLCVFTNLTPEHIEAHGGFENYKQAKIELFRHTASLPPKVIGGKRIPRIEILNADDVHAKDFIVKGFESSVSYGIDHASDIRARDIVLGKGTTEFYVGDSLIKTRLSGKVNVYNALAALATAEALGIPYQDAAKKISDTIMPGRFEFIDEGQPFTIIVDYAYEPAALQALFSFAEEIKSGGRIIHLTGSAGGGRDVARRGVIGRLSHELADVTIVTNEDPYDENPRHIINDVANAAIAAGGRENETVFRIDERREAIAKAIAMAKPGDVVLITGKGSEPVMAVGGGRKIAWDDREEARRAIRSAKNPLK